VDQAGQFQAPRRRVDFRAVVVLDVEELVGRRQTRVDLADVEHAPAAVRRRNDEVGGHIRERHILFAGGEDRQRPVRYERQRGQRRRALQRLPPRDDPVSHALLPPDGRRTSAARWWAQ
jgi:hypothetical protein